MIRAAALLVTVLLLGGCGVRPTGVVYAGEAPVGTASPTLQAKLFFLEDGVPIQVLRPVGAGDPQRVFDALLSGPTPDERARGLRTELTEVKQIAVHELDGRTLLLETVPPALKLPPGAFAQISCTAAALSDRTALKISYLNGGFEPYQRIGCPQEKGLPPARSGGIP